MRRVKKSSFIVTALPSPSPLQNHGETFLLTLWLLQWERRTQNCELTYGSHYSNLTPWALQGNLQSSTTTVVRLHLAGGGGCCNTQILADWIHTCSDQAVIPTSGSAYLQNQTGGHTLTREHRWAQIGLIHLLKWGLLPALGPSLPCPNKKLNHGTIHWRVSSSHVWPEWLITPERHVAQ